MEDVSILNIEQLLQAAEFLERREREHGYASPYSHEANNKRKHRVKRLNSNSRSTHNELEKNRRAHLRTCLERLKEMVPLDGDMPRHTTLGLLTNAKDFIVDLEEKSEGFTSHKDQLCREQRFLRRRLDYLQSTLHRQRQDSTGSSLASDDSEKDDVDVIGYDSDNRSIESDMNSSDGDLAVATKEIIITDL
ncbi:max-interacting protein 1 isoform X2 [Strongylocentrotus purpuratus]|uniref:BHLH domain-containing protein n=1 Tax=Strongylocentrotus purpuratus TaxID=7668 RepID=A0A7M7HFR6_STRPU|nr:max-interacting protein 1 isoform X2 [Strongylocentrotus purpuratus]|eukprot:XP_011662780.1 PREDICTED: max-interacting protein 1 isoform X2 [Strongylocentrotus purpuratus]